jgi:hypothetical protein
MRTACPGNFGTQSIIAYNVGKVPVVPVSVAKRMQYNNEFNREKQRTVVTDRIDSKKV